MSNLVPRSSGFLATSDDLYAALGDAVQDMGSGGGVYMKFDGNSGTYSYGSTADELAPGSLLAMNALSLERGHICWKDEKVVDEIMVHFSKGAPPSKADLPDHGPYDDGDGWQEQSVITFKMIEEPFHELIFKATGIAKRNAVSRVVGDFMKSYKTNPGLVPIVEIDEVEFESKAKGARGARKHAPVFKIIDWRPEEDLVALTEGSEDDYVEDGVEQEALPAPEAEPEPEPQPTRRPPQRPAPARTQQAAPATRPAPQRPAGRTGARF